MKLGVITSLWAYAEELSVVESLNRIAALGLRHVDILGILHGNPLDLSQTEKEDINHCLHSLELIVGSLILLPPGNIATDNAAERRKCLDYVQAGIDFISYLGGTQVLINGGKRVFGSPHSKSWENAVDFIREASSYAQSKHVYITVEAEPYVYFLVNDLETTLKFVTDVNHPQCMTVLDMGHMNLSRDAPGSLIRAKAWTLRVHLSENDGILHANDILGSGTVDLAAYLQALENMKFEETCDKYGIDLVAVMELGVLGDNIPDPDEYARQSMDHVLKVVPHLEL